MPVDVDHSLSEKKGTAEGPACLLENQHDRQVFPLLHHDVPNGEALWQPRNRSTKGKFSSIRSLACNNVFSAELSPHWRRIFENAIITSIVLG